MSRTLSRWACAPVALLVAAVGLTPPPADACSRVFWNSNKQAKVVARTTDLYRSDEARLVYSPRGVGRTGGAGENSARWESRYATVALTAFGAATSDGLNERGLACHLLYLHGTEYEAPDGRPGVSNLGWAQFLLDNCDTVKAALAEAAGVRVASVPAGGRDWPVHLAMEDATGDSAVVEFVGGKAVVHRGAQYTVMTNEPPLADQLAHLAQYKSFGGTRKLPGDIDPQSRFVRAATFLKTLPEPRDTREAVAGVLSVVRATMVPFGAKDTGESGLQDTWPTLWVCAADLTHPTYYFQSTKSPNLFWVDFKSLDPTGPPLSLDPYDPTLVGDVSKALKPVVGKP